MKNRNKTVSLRLNEEEYNALDISSNNLHMTISQYLRSMINNTTPAMENHNQEIATMICKLYIRLNELGLENEEITDEVHRLCQMLS